MELGLGVLIAILMIGLVILLLSGMPIAFALLMMGLAGLYFLVGTPKAAAISAWNQVNNYVFAAAPLYILMGEVLHRSGLSEEIFTSLNKWLGRFPGGLIHPVIGSCAFFAAVSGSSVATAATMGRVAFPAMKQRNYNPQLMYGAVAAGGTLGILIPPSIIMIIYGGMANVSIGRLFFGGFIPGIVLALTFMTYVALWARISPSIAPASAETVSWKDRFRALAGLATVFIIMAIVFGGIYFGIMTPTEAAAIGALAALIIATVRGRMSLRLLADALWGTLIMTSMILMIIAAAAIFGYVVHFLRIPVLIMEWVGGLGVSPYTVLLFVCLLLYVLGCFIEGTSVLVILTPILVPLMVSIGFDPVWFGIIFVINIEVALITPPVGLNLFVIKGVEPESTFGQIFMGAAPFVGMMTLMIILLAAFPQLVLWLPDLAFGGG